jgi:hypothetical protein
MGVNQLLERVFGVVVRLAEQRRRGGQADGRPGP